MSDAFNQPLPIMRQQHHRALRQARDVARATRTRQAHGAAVALPPDSVQVAEAVHFGGAQKTNLHASLLQQPHHVEHRAAKRRAAQVDRIAHSENRLIVGSLADDAVFVEPDGARRVRAFRHGKSQQRQAHPDEDPLAIVDLPRGGSHHQFAGGISAGIRFAGSRRGSNRHGSVRQAPQQRGKLAEVTHLHAFFLGVYPATRGQHKHLRPVKFSLLQPQLALALGELLIHAFAVKCDHARRKLLQLLRKHDAPFGILLARDLFHGRVSSASPGR